MSDPRLGADWFRAHLLEDLLPHWLAASTTPSGLFLPHLDRQWQRLPDQFGTLVSQSRLIYNFTVGYRLTGRQDYADAARRGAEYLTTAMRDHECGGWYWACEVSGVPADDAKDSYGHAFVVFGLAHAARALGEPAFAGAAVEAWQTLAGPLTDSHGGLILRRPRDFSPPAPEADGPRSQNPMMHCFEALLALAQVPGCEFAADDALRIADFVLERRAQAGACGLPEVYDLDWQPLPVGRGGRVDIGHQFEWAYLLSAAARQGLPARLLEVADAMLDDGLRLGYDREAGGIWADASLTGNVINPDKGCWQQCEAIRALLHHAVLRGREDAWEPARHCLEYVKGNLLDPVYGGWYADANLSKGNHWKLDYHPTGMCEEVLRLAGQ